MSPEAAAASLRPAAPRWMPPDSPLALWVGMFVSLLLHALLFAGFMHWVTHASGCNPGTGGGETGGEYRSIGLKLRAAENPTEHPSDQPDDQGGEATPRATDSAFSATIADPSSLRLPESPPVPLSLPKGLGHVIGPGARSASGDDAPAGTDVGSTVKSSGPRSVGSMAGELQGGTSFLGIRDKGTRFVYVLDSSGSMTNFNAIRFAKMHLMSSLASLEPTQQFQILFYNQSVRMLALDGDPRPQLYWATGINQTLAGQFVSSVLADLGTDHVPAIKKGLALRPEVMFFLTDADEPRLTAGELDEIRRFNGGRTRIHCVEFGQGPELEVENFLKRLARQNGGAYRYIDVTRIAAGS